MRSQQTELTALKWPFKDPKFILYVIAIVRAVMLAGRISQKTADMTSLLATAFC